MIRLWPLLLVLPACSPNRSAPSPDSSAPATSTAGGDSALVARLEQDARALVNASGCSADSQCTVAPVGAKACGGPRDYLPYCRLTTDSTRLFSKLAELEKAEKAWNAKSGAMSTCELRAPPIVGLSDQQCRAK
jgi:hypothetical protein